MKFFANIFLKGLLVVLPLAITFGLIYWLFSGAEQLLRVPLQVILPEGWYIPGMGVVSACGLIFLCGILVQTYLTKHLFQFLEWLIGQIPIVKTLYGSARDLMQFALGDKGQDEMQKVVSVEMKDDMRLIGFVTNESVELGEKTGLLSVYFPMSYQVGGYLVYLPKEKCEMLDISVEQAMQQVLTAHMASGVRDKKKGKQAARKAKDALTGKKDADEGSSDGESKKDDKSKSSSEKSAGKKPSRSGKKTDSDSKADK